MNKKLSPLLLLILGIICLYLGGVTSDSIGLGLSMGGLACIIVAFIGGIKKLKDKGSHHYSTSENALIDYSATVILKSARQSEVLAKEYKLSDQKQHDLVNQLVAFYLLMLGVQFAASRVSAETSKIVIENVIEYIARIVHKQGKRTGASKSTEAELHDYMRKEILTIISKYSSMPISGSTEPGSLLWEYGAMIAETVDTTTAETLKRCIRFVTSLEVIDTKELVKFVMAHKEFSSTKSAPYNRVLIGLIIIGLLLGGYHLYQYNRTPSYSDQMSYVYECEEYLANNVHKDSEDRREIAKKVCGCLWPDLVGRYHTIGKINEKARIDGKVSIGNSEVNAMSVTCLEDYFNSR